MVVGGIGFTAASTLSFSKLGEIAAFGGCFPFLVGLIRVLVRDIWRFGTPSWVMVVMVLRVRLGVALVVMVVVAIEILISTPKVAAVIIIVRSCGHTVFCICNSYGGCIGSAIGFLQGVLQRWSRLLLLSNYDFNNSTASIDTGCILSLLLKSAESGRLVLLMLGSSIASATRGALKSPVRETSSVGGRQRKSLGRSASGIWWNITWGQWGSSASILSGPLLDSCRHRGIRCRGICTLTLRLILVCSFLLVNIGSTAWIFRRGWLWGRLLLSHSCRFCRPAMRTRARSRSRSRSVSTRHSSTASTSMETSSSTTTTSATSRWHSPWCEHSCLGVSDWSWRRWRACCRVLSSDTTLGVRLAVFLVRVSKVTTSTLTACFRSPLSPPLWHLFIFRAFTSSLTSVPSTSRIWLRAPMSMPTTARWCLSLVFLIRRCMVVATVGSWSIIPAAPATCFATAATTCTASVSAPVASASAVELSSATVGSATSGRRCMVSCVPSFSRMLSFPPGLWSWRDRILDRAFSIFVSFTWTPSVTVASFPPVLGLFDVTASSFPPSAEEPWAPEAISCLVVVWLASCSLSLP